MRRLFLALLVGAGIVAVHPGRLQAHKFHVTMTEADFNAESGYLEVAVQVALPDLERALRRLDGNAGRAKSQEERDARVAAYLDSTWVVLDAAGEARSLEWVGAEYTVKDAWLYFQVALPAGLHGAVVENRMFLELESEQVNTINFRQGKAAFTETCDRVTPRRKLAVPDSD